ncbi:MAG: flavodoxin-dependent (E)-4-hydroxy-3-methylbut-2-enyl-diphosphate synthase [FCB group bacterium]|nr:flavodoxin-dependent (E)-4-hydroxy-3-methylbut-2-enyl-diphosphate synthase [FCB group bacterium]
MNITRRHSRQVDVGGVKIGGDAPVVLQSMTNTDTRDIEATVRQIKALTAAGCDLVRVAVPDQDSARAFGEIREKAGVPLIADIHFDYRLALKAIENGADKIRINPGNIGSFDRVKKILEAAAGKGIPIRIGVNAGSLEKRLREEKGVSGESLLESALNQVHAIEKEGFYDIVIASKASSALDTIEVNRLLASETDYPLHLGLTEAGLPGAGSIKSAVTIGALLAEGIGDTIRVSLSGDPLYEIRDGLIMLRALGLKPPGLDIISCPTCARCHGEVAEVAAELQEKLDKIAFPLKVAVMGCEVNGPGEAREADVGVAFTKKGGALIFRKGEIVGRTDNALDSLLNEIANISVED